MSIPNSRSTLIEYALRSLGKPVIEINVDETQVEDRLDEALQVYQEYHYDATEKFYEVHQLTANNVADKFIEFDPNPYIGIIQILPATSGPGSGMFNLEYQMRLQDYVAFGASTMGGDLTGYTLYQQNLALLRETLTGVAPLRYTKNANRLYIDWNWLTDGIVGRYIVIESFKILDPNEFVKVYNDMFLKQYFTALVKRQWGANLSKFAGVQLPGGVTLNGDTIYQQANDDITKLREELQSKFELPVDFMMA